MARIDVSTFVEIDDHDLDERIIHAAAEHLLTEVSMTARYGGAVVDLINARLSEIVGERVEQMLDKEVTVVDRFGDPKPGPRKTFRDVFADTAENFLEGRVNSDGRPLDGGGYSSISRLEYLIRKTSTSSMEHECRVVAKQFKDELQARAKKALAAVVAEHVKKIA